VARLFFEFLPTLNYTVMLRTFLITTFFLSILSSNILPNQVYFTLLKEFTLEGEPKDIVIDNSKAFIITSANMYSVDILEPYPGNLIEYTGIGKVNSITFIGRIAYSTGNYEGIKYYDFTKSPPVYKNKINSFGAIKKIVIDNGYLFAVNNSYGLQVYDVNIPDFPLFKNTQIIPGNANGIFVKDRKAYVTGSNGNLYIIDAHDITMLPIVGQYNFATSFYEAYVDGGYAFLPQGAPGVQVININKLPNPEWITNIFGRTNAKQVISSNFYVWLADENSIEAYFNYDFKTFLFTGNYDNGKAVINRIADIEGKYLYVCSSDKKLKILKIDYRY